MERVAVDAAESRTPGTGSERVALSAALGATDLALNRYRVEPGGRLPAGLHAHLDQEELFVVLDGTATFETLVPGDGAAPDSPAERAATAARGRPREVTVEAGEAVRFAPGEFQAGSNAGEGRLVLLAVGAPRESDEVRIPVECRSCGAVTLRIDARDGLSFVCPDCGRAEVPRDCPDCGGGDLRVTLGDGGGTVAACGDCGATYDRPPVRDPGDG